MSVKKKPLVVVTRKLPDSIETRMRELFDARINLDDTPLTKFIQTQTRNLPVLEGSELANEPATDVLVLAWRYTADISARHDEFVKEGGRFFRVLPDLAYATYKP